jgi:nucleoid DNA-binding protein
MKMAILTALSGGLIAGMSFNSAAATQGTMEDAWVAKYGGSKASAHEKFQAWEDTLKSELASKRAVKIDGIGTFRPQELSGKQRSSTLGGKTYTTDSYAMVKKPEVTTDSEFKAKMVAAGKMTDAEAAQMGAAYKTTIATSLKRGVAVQQFGLGEFTVSRKPAHIGTWHGSPVRVPSQKVVHFNDGYGTHTRLKVDKDLKASLN